MRDRMLRAVLGLMVLVAAEIGVWAQFFPRSFYDDFPGAGRGWVALDGPYNEHLVRDVGGLYLALAAVSAAAAFTLLVPLVRVAAVAALVSGVPHLVYHATHLEPYETGDAVANVVALTVGVLLPVAALVLTRRREGGDVLAPE